MRKRKNIPTKAAESKVQRDNTNVSLLKPYDEYAPYYGGNIPASTITASLPEKFKGSKRIADRYAAGYQFGQQIANERDKTAPYIASAMMLPLDIGMAADLGVMAVDVSPIVAQAASRILKQGASGMRQAKNFIQSRRIMRDIARRERAGDWNAPYDNPGPNDMQGLSYFLESGPADKVVQKGRTVKIREEPGVRPYTYKDNHITVRSAQEAADYARTHPYAPGFKSIDEVRMQMAKDAQSLMSGDKVTLITDDALSKDSYPLLEKTLLREYRNGKGALTVTRDGNTYRMIRLNNSGARPNSIQRIDKAIPELRRELNDPNIPGRVSLFGKHYVPAIQFELFSCGGKKRR